MPILSCVVRTLSSTWLLSWRRKGRLLLCVARTLSWDRKCRFRSEAGSQWSLGIGCRSLLQKCLVCVKYPLRSLLQALQLSCLLRGFASPRPPLGLLVKLFGEVRLLRPALIGFQVLEPPALVSPIPSVRQPDTSVLALKLAIVPAGGMSQAQRGDGFPCRRPGFVGAFYMSIAIHSPRKTGSQIVPPGTH